MAEAVTDEMDTLRHEAVIETVDVLQRAVWLFMHAQRQAQDCAALAYRMAAMIYGGFHPAQRDAQNAAWWARMDAAIENACADITGQERPAPRDDCPAACDCETCPDKDACTCC